MKPRIFIAAAVVLAVGAATAASVIAEGTYGSRTDPLVTLSYINETVVPGVMDELDEIVEERAEELTREFDKKLSETAPGVVSESDSFKVISLTAGQTVRCGVGTELMLRIGSAVAAGEDSPRLVDETDGSELSAAGAELTKNHMYIVTIKNNGILATASTKVLIRGEYTISQ